MALSGVVYHLGSAALRGDLEINVVQPYDAENDIVNYATRTQTLTLLQGFDDLEITERQNQNNRKGSADLQSEVDPAFVACKALERSFPLDKVSDKFVLFLLNVDGPTHDVSKFPWRIRELGDIEKLSCKKGSYSTRSKFPNKFRREFSTHDSISLNA